MGIAPSEKHLEDWLVKDITADKYREIQDQFWYSSIIARQLTVPSGIIDLLVLGNNTWRHLGVIELKKGAIDDHAVSQLLRYIANIRGVYREIGIQLTNQGTITSAQLEGWIGVNSAINGKLIGHSVSSPHIITICEAQRIELILYDFDGEGYEFELVPYRDMPDANRTYEVASHTELGALIKDVLFAHLDANKKIQERRI